MSDLSDLCVRVLLWATHYLRKEYHLQVGDYKPEFFYWETLEMLRKVSLTGLLIFFSKGSMLQIVAAVMITFLFLVATSLNKPFKDELANKFKLATECALMITLVFAIMLKVDLSKEVRPAAHPPGCFFCSCIVG